MLRQETPVWSRIHPAPLPPPGSSLPLTVAPVWDLGACLSPDGVKRLRNLGCASSPSPEASTQPCPGGWHLLIFPLAPPPLEPRHGSQHSSRHSDSRVNPHPPGERGCFWPGSRNTDTGGFPGNPLQFLPARQVQPRGPVLQLNSEPHNLPAPSRARCCCGAISGGDLWPPLGQLGRVTVPFLWLHTGTGQT